MNFEITTSNVVGWRSASELLLHSERKTGLEPATSTLEGWHSTNWAISAFMPLSASVTPPLYSYCWVKRCQKPVRADGGIRTPDILITSEMLWPTELHRLILWGWRDSNPLTKRTSFTDWLNSPTLTHPQIDFLPYPNVSLKSNSVVGLVGFEPTRSEETRFTVWRANQLLNRPKKQNALLYLPKK